MLPRTINTICGDLSSVDSFPEIGLADAVINAEGCSLASFENFAMTLIDEPEKPKHTRVRFTIGH
jgi:putative NADH-flavin reductase